jgi:hypothetical protein
LLLQLRVRGEEKPQMLAQNGTAEIGLVAVAREGRFLVGHRITGIEYGIARADDETAMEAVVAALRVDLDAILARLGKLRGISVVINTDLLNG